MAVWASALAEVLVLARVVGYGLFSYSARPVVCEMSTCVSAESIVNPAACDCSLNLPPPPPRQMASRRVRVRFHAVFVTHCVSYQPTLTTTRSVTHSCCIRGSADGVAAEPLTFTAHCTCTVHSPAGSAGFSPITCAELRPPPPLPPPSTANRPHGPYGTIYGASPWSRGMRARQPAIPRLLVVSVRGAAPSPSRVRIVFEPCLGYVDRVGSPCTLLTAVYNRTGHAAARRPVSHGRRYHSDR